MASKKIGFPKKKKITLTKAKNKARDAFSIYIRLRDSLKTTGSRGHLLCFTCGKVYPSFGVGCAQAGHFIPGRHPSIFFDERGCHGQCYNCNINLKGNWVKYEERMLKEYGQKVIDELKEKDKILTKYTVANYLELEIYFKKKIEELGESKGD